MKEEYTVHNVIAAECTLEPMICLHCDGSEVTFDQYIGDAYCADCGKWQLEESTVEWLDDNIGVEADDPRYFLEKKGKHNDTSIEC